jgi:hypothetical protein
MRTRAAVAAARLERLITEPLVSAIAQSDDIGGLAEDRRDGAGFAHEVSVIFFTRLSMRVSGTSQITATVT